MPFWNNLLTHDTPTRGLCHTEKDGDGQDKCKGCNGVQRLFKIKKEWELQGNSKFPAKPETLHSSFLELADCAKKCVTCRIFHRALLLNQVTYRDATSLESDASHEVYAKLVEENGMIALRIDVETFGSTDWSAIVQCSDSKSVMTSKLPANAYSPDIEAQLGKWLHNCVESHWTCNAYSWSSDRNPTRLLHILSDTQVQLIESPQGHENKLKYTALSYCWGKGCTCIKTGCKCPKPEEKTGAYDELNDEDKRVIRAGKTTRGNIFSRYGGFSSSGLPATIRDAIVLTRRLQLEYIWIDSICIIQEDEDDFRKEAIKMQEAYGNAIFTICASSSFKATDSLLQERKAWSYDVRPCRFGNQWLSNTDMTFAEMQARSPLCARAWTLQEERLSPRIMFWAGQQMFWSCPEIQSNEMNLSHTSAKSAHSDTTNSPQSFLKSCTRGSEDAQHKAWQTIVESYSARRLTKPGDRFPALSGLATRYLEANKNNSDEYIAGLWRQTFQEDLGWSVFRPAARDAFPALQNMTPSWSWASLPGGTATKVKHNYENTPHFSLLKVEANSSAKFTNPIAGGAEVKSIWVRGRMREFLAKGSMSRRWDEVIRNKEGQEGYSFDDHIERAGWSSDLQAGLVVTYEPRRDVVISRLDYRQDFDRLQGGELQIRCLEISKSAMLLLERLNGSNYRRVGISHKYWPRFFDGTLPVDVRLW
ncbi:MAG: hypothetical protein MMC23_008842 [Stictis urceolatum]|nr:hypothetical protein [Stictis urceolata]